MPTIAGAFIVFVFTGSALLLTYLRQEAWSATVSNASAPVVIVIPQSATDKPDNQPKTPSTNAPKLPSPTIPQPMAIRSRITITNSEGLILHNTNTNAIGLTISVYYTNTGNLAAMGATRSSLIDIVDTELTTAEQNEFADRLAEVKWNPARVHDEVEPGEHRFFSFPDDDAGTSQIAARSADVIAGRARLYLFVAQKYRDASLLDHKVNVTEFCGWFSGGSSPDRDLQIRDVCGRNRIFQEVSK
jgi:hypothetical protein